MNLAFQILPPVLLLLLLLGWLGPAAWMYRDASRRLRGPRLPLAAFAAGAALPLAAPLAWALLRPPETLEERAERELARRHLEQLLDPGERCLVCRTPVEPRFVCCPCCATELRRRCRGCSEPLEFAWSVCPYCGEDVREEAQVLRLTA